MLTPATFQQRQDERFADNEFENITEGSFRALAADMLATFVPLAEANVPAYDPKRFYAEQYLVTFEGLYYRAKIQGFLLAPTPGQETAEWKPDLKPLPPTLPYREMSVQQAQDWSSDGLLVPSTLYRLTQRVDADGAALDDVLVVALSRRHVNEADAYAIGVDPQTRQEYLLPVSYDLATDTTAARAAGGGGAGDAYTKSETNALLAAKGSAQVQAQHTLQLNTLGVQASPVMAYLESGDVAGYSTLDEALADTRPKTFMRFNVATVTLTASNDPANPGWASYVDGAGATLELGANVVLSLPGADRGALLFRNFFIFQAAGTRGGRVKLLASGNAGTEPGLLPLLDGQCAVPLELGGGAASLLGSYGLLIGTGTAHLFEPGSVGSTAATVTLVPHAGGAGGSGYTDTEAKAAALASLVAGNAQHQGVQVQDVGGVPKLVVQYSVVEVMRFQMQAPGSGNFATDYDVRPAGAGGAYKLSAYHNVGNLQLIKAGPSTTYDGPPTGFPNAGAALEPGIRYDFTVAPVDSTQPVYLEFSCLL